MRFEANLAKIGSKRQSWEIMKTAKNTVKYGKQREKSWKNTLNQGKVESLGERKEPDKGKRELSLECKKELNKA